MLQETSSFASLYPHLWSEGPSLNRGKSSTDSLPSSPSSPKRHASVSDVIQYNSERKRRNVELERFWSSLVASGENFSPQRTPSLGGLTKRKLLALLGAYLVWYLSNSLLHSVFRIERGTLRVRFLKSLLRHRKRIFFGIVTLIALRIWYKLSYYRGRQKSQLDQVQQKQSSTSPFNALPSSLLSLNDRVENSIESFVRSLHNFGQEWKALQTYSQYDIGWLVRRANPALRDKTKNVTKVLLGKLARLNKSRFASPYQTETSSPGNLRLPSKAAIVGATKAAANKVSLSSLSFNPFAPFRSLLHELHLLPKSWYPPLSRRSMIDCLGIPPKHIFPHGWDSLTILLVPGLLCGFYPLYFTPLQDALLQMGIDCHISNIDTGASVQKNAETLRKEIEDLYELSSGHRKIVIYAHSKGAVDTLAALSVYPALRKMITAFISLQAPHGGSWLANDINNTSFQKQVVLKFLEKILQKAGAACFDLSYQQRVEHFAQ
eukprot:g491.t1